MNRYMIYVTLLSVMLLCICTNGIAQTPRIIKHRYTIFEGDTLMVARVAAIPIFGPGRRGNQALKRYKRLINAVRVTYPIAQEAKRTLTIIEDQLGNIPKGRDRKSYIKELEQELKEEYTPRLKRLSFYQGRILIKLIDRQTGTTSFEMVKELRGGFSAFMWQSLARLFSMNLKTEYDSENEDVLLEEIVQLYEDGLI